MSEETPMTETPKIPERLWVRLAGDHMRKWSTEPFDEADACYPRIDLARPAPAEGDRERVARAMWRVCGAVSYDEALSEYGSDSLETVHRMADAAIAALASPEDAIPAAPVSVEEALDWAYSGDGLDECALTIQGMLRPFDKPTEPNHAVQIGIRKVIDKIRERAQQDRRAALREMQSIREEMEQESGHDH